MRGVAAMFCRMIGKAALRALRELSKLHEREMDAEIVRETGAGCWLGNRRIQSKTLDELTIYLAVTPDYGGGLERWRVTNTGLAIARRPELASEVFDAICERKPFTVGADDRIQLMIEF